MEKIARFLEESELAERIKVPTRVVVHRSTIGPGRLARILKDLSFSPEGGETCELESGGKILARGKIVRKGGKAFFKVLETEED
jgi:hypothetical protein